MPEGFASVHKPPAFKYRGVFTNDEDMLGHLRPDPLGQGLFGLETANQLYETILRNKANLIVPGTTTNADEPHIALAHRRGLAIAHSHFEIVGLGTFRWLDGSSSPNNPPPALHSALRALLTPQVKSRHAITVQSALKSNLLATTGGKGG